MALTEDDDFVADRTASYDSNWVSQIETTLQWCVQQWHLTIGVQRQSGLNGYVVDAHMDDGSMAVLKVRRPDSKMRREADSLTAFGAVGVISLLDRNDELGVTLLERAEPGEQLAERLADVDPDAVVCELVSTWRDVDAPASAVTLTDQAERWARSLEAMPTLNLDAPVPDQVFVDSAASLRQLAASQGEPQLLHGDLHLGNIISATRRPWLAVDPKGLAGELLFDLAWWLRDPPLGADDADQMVDPLRNRLRAMTAQGVDADRCLAWAQACAVVLAAARTCALSAWDARRHAACAEALRRL